MRLVLHILLGILLWVVFAYYWYLVFQRPVSEHTKFALIVVGAMVLGVYLFLTGWIFHNKGIYRRKGPRKQRLTGVKRSASDFLGRQLVVADDELLKSARYIEVHIDDDTTSGRKVFRASPDAT